MGIDGFSYQPFSGIPVVSFTRIAERTLPIADCLSNLPNLDAMRATVAGYSHQNEGNEAL
jgi:hypothetical protein